ncbi:MAG: amino-acid N-acetyltransferase [Sulfurospirillum sp.]|nr:amino-acid N-acetyltransferase [Sulfurospirillum sp.]DAB34275.1 MAG TPA: GNAT family N-acetyltransferase [Sulfurospirillum sp. UBA12182]
MIRYEKAKLSDIALMQELVKEEVQKGIILFRSSDEMATNIRSYILAKDDDTIIGFGALHFHAFDLAEVRSLIVDKNYQGKGIGRGIVEALLQEGKNLGVKKIFTLTYVKGFFESLGFKEIPKESLPAHKIWADCIKCKHFPVCDEVALIQTI